jgi:hypothetical protein
MITWQLYPSAIVYPHEQGHHLDYKENIFYLKQIYFSIIDSHTGWWEGGEGGHLMKPLKRLSNFWS